MTPRRLNLMGTCGGCSGLDSSLTSAPSRRSTTIFIHAALMPRRKAQGDKASETRRADILLVERNIFESRAQAQAAIAAGFVKANGSVIAKPSASIPLDAAIDATPAHPYVSRGGLKLAHALAQSGFHVSDRVCLDVGASTGGFSQVLLDAGARRVYAVDVGTAQLHPSASRAIRNLFRWRTRTSASLTALQFQMRPISRSSM